MLFVICNEAFGYTHKQVLQSSLATLLSMLREHAHLSESRKRHTDEGGNGRTVEEDTVEVTDFDTGKKIRVKRVECI